MEIRGTFVAADAQRQTIRAFEKDEKPGDDEPGRELPAIGGQARQHGQYQRYGG